MKSGDKRLPPALTRPTPSTQWRLPLSRHKQLHLGRDELDWFQVRRATRPQHRTAEKQREVRARIVRALTFVVVIGFLQGIMTNGTDGNPNNGSRIEHRS